MPDEITVKTNGISGEITAKGDGAARLSNSLADLISPLTEASGMLGDCIRSYRQKSTINALNETHRLSKETGLQLKPVAPKFLVDWSEKASLEDNDSEYESLASMWGGLLFSESIKSSPSHFLYKRILSEIDYRHKDFLLWLAGSKEQAIESENHFSNFGANIKKLSEMTFAADQSTKITFDHISEKTESNGVRLIMIYYTINQVFLDKKNSYERYGIPFYNDDEKYIMIEHLRNLGLVKIYESSQKVKKLSPGHNIFAEYIVLTRVGIQFLLACSGIKTEA